MTSQAYLVTSTAIAARRSLLALRAAAVAHEPFEAERALRNIARTLSVLQFHNEEAFLAFMDEVMRQWRENLAETTDDSI